MADFKINGTTFVSETGGTLSVDASQIKVNGTAVIGAASGFMFRNKIINGAMQINQRGSTAVSAGTDNVYSVDRFNVGTAGGTAAYTLNNAAEVPTGNGFAKSFHLDVTTADTSIDTSHGYYLRYKFEGQDLQDLCKGTSSAKSVTLSFWVKSPKEGIHIVELFDTDNTRHICKSYNVAVANTWQEVTLNFAGDTTGTFDNDTLSSLIINWWLAAGDNFTSGTLNTSWNAYTGANRAVGQVNVMHSASNNFYLTGVQLEIGTVATPFEHRPIGMELSSCQRYYQKLLYKQYWGNSGFGRIRQDTGRPHIMISLLQEMRDTPNDITLPPIGQSSGNITFLVNEGYPGTHGSLENTNATPNTVEFQFDGFSSLGSQNQVSWAYVIGGPVAFRFGAEL